MATTTEEGAVHPHDSKDCGRPGQSPNSAARPLAYTMDEIARARTLNMKRKPAITIRMSAAAARAGSIEMRSRVLACAIDQASVLASASDRRKGNAEHLLAYASEH